MSEQRVEESFQTICFPLLLKKTSLTEKTNSQRTFFCVLFEHSYRVKLLLIDASCFNVLKVFVASK